MKVWKLMVLEIEQKAITKFGETKYIDMLSILSDKEPYRIINFFKTKRAPTLNVYVDLLEIVDTNN